VQGRPIGTVDCGGRLPEVALIREAAKNV